ncbi:uncharacterized protein LOC129768885 [Toxorhynchites rutilus septentrionalis]|uniref:uncharacterized protein LOC129768885 n=1 Tax=Toxorhynchites rutilus septentrionalis TaxID=329112 RepID=UPI00247939B3|nr:uncharacterized protein LOC129768885 [Toxorhynchites rutilus septentrionalis]
MDGRFVMALSTCPKQTNRAYSAYVARVQERTSFTVVSECIGGIVSVVDWYRLSLGDVGHKLCNSMVITSLESPDISGVIMTKIRLLVTVILRVLITVSVFLAAMIVIHFTAINPREIFIPCDRPCSRAEWPRICRYRLVIEKRSLLKSRVDHKNIISSDEAAVGIGSEQLETGSIQYYFLVNGKHTGPVLDVCERDFIVIDVENRIPGRSISIHWTGQSQRHTPFMDGVSMVTQCPIVSFTTFQYKFQADRAGTHLYYGFSGEERNSGLVGALVVHSVYEQKQYQLTKNCLNDTIWIVSEINGNFLINGNRRLVQKVQSGAKYRFRVAYVAPLGQTNCVRWLEIEDHKLLVIALDGNLIEPVMVQKVALSDGDRIDLIVQTTELKRDYEIRLTAGMGNVSRKCTPVFASRSEFRLKYVEIKTNGLQHISDESDPVVESSTEPAPSVIQWAAFNPGRIFCSVTSGKDYHQSSLHQHHNQSCLLDAKAKDAFPVALRDVDRRIILVVAKRKVMKDIFGERLDDISYSVNGFSFVFPSVLMLQNIHDKELNRTTCSSGKGHRRMPKKCHRQADRLCECVHIEHIETGHRVELILINEDEESDHSYHLHGHQFHLLAAMRFDEGWQSQLEKVVRNFDRPVIRDTIRIERRTLVVLRFTASSAGLWMLRELGAGQEWSRGLDVLLSVETQNTEIDIPPDFPACKSFVGPKYFLI